jgi:ribose 5-phosphate isomerase B
VIAIPTDMTSKMIAMAADHAGYEMKDVLKDDLRRGGYEVVDLGTDGPSRVDYPDYAHRLCAVLDQHPGMLGVLVCGSGIGMAVAANRHPHIRAALVHDATTARLARQHNDANVLVLGARTTGIEVGRDCLKAFLAAAFEGGRHADRVAKLNLPSPNR